MNSRLLASASAALLVVGLAAPAAMAQSSDSGSADVSTGSLDSGSLQGGSANGVLPTATTSADQDCHLPNLGGSVAKFYPLLGISGVPALVVNIATSALDGFPNLLNVVGGEAVLNQVGSLEGPLCSGIFGGSMTTTTSTTAPTTTTSTPTSASTSVPTSTSGAATTSTPASSKAQGAGSLPIPAFGS